MVKLTTPLNELTVRSLKVGKIVYISGLIITARDRVHKYLIDNKPPIPELRDSIIYHSGPIVKDSRVLAAGPTTSSRLEPYTAELIAHYGIKAIIGKGGMGDRTALALKSYGAIYLQTTGGAAVYLAEKIKRVLGVRFLEEFGMAEAMWFFEVEDFPAIITMDSHGGNLHKDIEEGSKKAALNLIF
ncbi:MAG: FumA C-terminus/TtdB family hydratase beta subunit [Thermodesulfovibrionales bacterium]|nr:FumA C-terminus/TtdB family hydratase beta subunit [Thermodesulfovibrionales bacterium]